MIGTFIGGLLLGIRAEFNFVAGTGWTLVVSAVKV